MGAPERTDILWRSPLAARDFRLGFVQRGDFIGMQRLFRGKLQKEAAEAIAASRMDKRHDHLNDLLNE